MMRKKPQVAVFFGGDSQSSDLSEETGFWACQYIPRSKYRVTPVRVAADGKWQVPLGGLPERGPVKKMMKNLFAAVPAVPQKKGLERLLRKPVDVLMTLIRGRGGDDGAMHGLGNMLDIPVAGSPIKACQRTSDKYVCGQSLGDLVSTPYGRRYKQADGAEEIINDIREEFVPPLFVKPIHQEGSVAVTEVASINGLGPAVKRALREGDVLVQGRAEGTEITMTLFDDKRGNIHVLPATAVMPGKATFYDHLARRREGRVTLNTLSSDNNPLLDEAEGIARDVYEAGIKLQPDQINFVHVMHRFSFDSERIDLFFTTDKWTGEVTNAEPHKCSELAWYPINNLPKQTIPYIKHAIQNITAGRYYSEYNEIEEQILS